MFNTEFIPSRAVRLVPRAQLPLAVGTLNRRVGAQFRLSLEKRALRAGRLLDRAGCMSTLDG